MRWVWMESLSGGARKLSGPKPTDRHPGSFFSEFAGPSGPFVFWGAALLYVLLWGRLVNVAPSNDEWIWIDLFHQPVAALGWFKGLAAGFMEHTGGFWRPLTGAPLLLGSGESYAIPQILKLASVVLAAFLLVRVARGLGLSGIWASAAGAAFLLHQCLIIGSDLDWWGDVFSTFGVILVLFLSVKRAAEQISGKPYLIGLSVMTGIALLGKEAAISFPVIPAIMAVFWPGLTTKARKGLWIGAAVCSAMVAIYLSFRVLSGIGFSTLDDSEYYRLALGKNVIINVGLLGVALLSPVDTVRVATGSYIWKLFAGMTAAVALSVLVIALLRARRGHTTRMIIALALITVLIQGPTLMMPHVTEGNFSRSLPFGILACLLCLQSLAPIRRRMFQTCAWGAIALFTVLHLMAIDHKSKGVAIVHEKSVNFRRSVMTLMPEPPNQVITFVAEKTPKGYGIFNQPLWVLLDGDASLGLRHAYNRPNLETRLILVDSLDLNALSSDTTLSPCIFIDRHEKIRWILPVDKR